MLPGLFSAADISVSGLSAERTRMEVVANNIANANTTRTAEGEPFRRQRVLFTPGERSFSSIVNNQHSPLKGVAVAGIDSDPSEFPVVFDPGHPDADERGFVKMPNVQIMFEMVDLMTATRSYEANLKALQTFRQMQEQTLAVLQRLG